MQVKVQNADCKMQIAGQIRVTSSECRMTNCRADEVRGQMSEARSQKRMAELTTKTPRHEERRSGSTPVPSPQPLVPSSGYDYV